MNKDGRKKALILAGGGMKVAFQAGVMQVWMDEAGLEFDHADGCSGGVMNLAMYCQGLNGREIADNWRALKPLAGVGVNFLQMMFWPFAQSLFNMKRFRKNVFRKAWGLDWDRIRASEKSAGFNVYEFDRHELRVLPPSRMNEDFLTACIALPMWFPPVRIEDRTYIDPVYITDANLEDAIEKGADELWIIWTVSEDPKWDRGFINKYFQVIETSANGRLNRILKRIEKNNAAMDSGGTGEFGRRVDYKFLKAEVDLHYLFNFTNKKFRRAVEHGVEAAREWCRANGIPLKAPSS